MRTFKPSVTTVFCIVLAWSLFSKAFLQHAAGKDGYGGFPAAGCKDLHDYLNGQGFVPTPDSVLSDRVKLQEKFHGSFHGSRPFDVTIFRKASAAEGVHVETAYDFRGSAWSINDSAQKAQEFADALCQWLSEHQKRGLNAGL